ncbi:MAG: hypothetical protein ACTSU8_05780 [Alphaproteobacteria bacterium]
MERQADYLKGYSLGYDDANAGNPRQSLYTIRPVLSKINNHGEQRKVSFSNGYQTGYDEALKIKQMNDERTRKKRYSEFDGYY